MPLNMSENMQSLYGGAIQCHIPENFFDLSDILPVPDHQEVFVHHIGNVYDNDDICNKTRDAILSFEIIEQISRDGEDLARIILKDLARCNESVHHKLLTYAPLALKDADSTHPLKGILVTGIMDVIKGNVHYNGIVISTSIFIYILRLPEHRADILVIYQFPVDITTDTERELKAFQDILKTLRIVDRSLFAHRIPT